MTIVTRAAEQAPPRGHLAPMALAALGVVYGDIGTSPLYTFKTAIAWAGGEATPAAVLGMLSLIVWTLVITTSIKYVAIVMRADNDGEGGILALMSLLGIKHGERAGVIALGILGAALLYGDGAITPAISVLSALEGIKTPLPASAPYVLPLSVIVLVAVFSLQPQGGRFYWRRKAPLTGSSPKPDVVTDEPAVGDEGAGWVHCSPEKHQSHLRKPPPQHLLQ